MLEILSSWDFGALMEASHGSAYTFEWPLVGTHRAISLRTWYPINAAFFFLKTFSPLLPGCLLNWLKPMGYKYKNMMLLRFNTAGINLGVNAIFKISDGVDLKRVGVEKIPLF